MRSFFKKLGLGICLIPFLACTQIVTEIFRFQILSYIDYSQYALISILISLVSFIYLAHFFTRFEFFKTGLKTSLFLFFLPYSLLLICITLFYEDTDSSRVIDIIYLGLGGSLIYWLCCRGWPRLKQHGVLACFALFIIISYKPIKSNLFYALNHKTTSVKSIAVLKNIQQLDGCYLTSSPLTGKIIVLDVWNKSCGNCISGMPKLDALTQYYKNDTTVCIYSVYGAFEKSDSLGWYKAYLSRKFNNSVNYCFIENDKFDSLKINLFPVYFIIDKQGNCTKHEQLSMDKNTINSIYSKIEDLKNEN